MLHFLSNLGLLKLICIALFSSVATADRVLKATSLVTCMENSALSASTFDVVFTPDNRTVTYDVSATVEIDGNVTALVTVYAYGIKVIQETLNPCKMNLEQLCPLSPGQVDIESHSTLDASVVNDIPGVAYTVPDIDADVYVIVLDDNNKMQACIQASFANSKTVNHTAIKWVTAVIAGIGLLTSAILSMWGNSYTAAHIATNALSLFTYFQSVVIVSMEAVVKIPPIAAAWSENFAWSVGLIRVTFMQKIFRWYVQATGGNPTTYLSYHTISVLVQKRAQILHPRVRDYLASRTAKIGSKISDALMGTARVIESTINPDGTLGNFVPDNGGTKFFHNPNDPMPAKILKEFFEENPQFVKPLSVVSSGGGAVQAVAEKYPPAHPYNGRISSLIMEQSQKFAGLFRRVNLNDILDEEAHSSSTLVVLRGIKRVGYMANIEVTSIVLTGFTFFVLICLAITIVFGLVRLASMFMFKKRLQYYKTNWLTLLKGTMLRMVFIGFPQLLIWSFWEFIERDSAAVIILAVFFLILSLGIMAWNTFKMFSIGRRSLAEYQTPAYMLYSDPRVISKYGFLYTQFSASHYVFIVPILVYIFVKACFISFAQGSGKTQSLALFIIELAMLVLICWKRPYMDKMTNIMSIVTCVVMTLNAFFFMFYSQLFGQPQAVASIMGIIFFVLNAAFSLILLLFTLFTCTMVLIVKNPDSRYKPAKDDRASFIQDPGNNTSGVLGEFTALGEAAKADHDDSMLLSNGPASSFEEESGSNRDSNPFSNEKRESGYDSVIAESIDSMNRSTTMAEHSPEFKERW